MKRFVLLGILFFASGCADGATTIDAGCLAKLDAILSTQPQGQELVSALQNAGPDCAALAPYQIQLARGFAESGDVKAADHWLAVSRPQNESQERVVWRVRYLVEVQRGSAAGAERVARDAIKALPHFFFGYAALARVQTENGQDKQAIESIEIAKGLIAPEEKRLAAGILGPAAGSYYNEGRCAEALSLLQEDFSYFPEALRVPELAAVAATCASETEQSKLAQFYLTEHGRLRGDVPEALVVAEARKYISTK